MRGPEAFFDYAHRNFCDAVTRSGANCFYFTLAGFNICLKFAGNEMVDLLTKALKHLETGVADRVDLMICIWDSVSTQTAPIEFPWPEYHWSFRGEVVDHNTDRFYTVVDIHTKALHVYDRMRSLALYWIADFKSLPWWVSGSPLQLMIHWMMRQKGYQLTHAAVVGNPYGGVLLAGKGGSGKSTTSLACLKAGMNHVSEDYCLLSDRPEVRAYTVYNSAKIGENTLRWFPELEKHVDNRHRPAGDKAFLFYHQFQPEKVIANCPIKAVLALQIEERVDCQLEPIAADKALAALCFSTMWQLTHTGPAVFQHLKRVAESLPCYCLHLGRNFMQAPELIGSLL